VMPNMGGPEFAAWLTEARPGTKLIMMTGYADDLETLQAQCGPTRDFILKPFMPTQLLSAIRALLARCD
jgi:two-component system cell cycle sensor histidine kinase/response regulator CckA